MPNNKKGEAPAPNGGVREQIQNVGHQVQQGAEQVASRVQDGYGQAREGALHGYRQAEGAIARNPAPSLLIGFGVGMGVGLVLSAIFAQEKEKTWAEKHLPESLQDIPFDRYKSLAEGRYKSLVDSLKSLPKSVHDYLPHSIAKHIG